MIHDWSDQVGRKLASYLEFRLGEWVLGHWMYSPGY